MRPVMRYEDFIHCLRCLKEGHLALAPLPAEAFWGVLCDLAELGTLSDALNKVEVEVEGLS